MMVDDVNGNTKVSGVRRVSCLSRVRVCVEKSIGIIRTKKELGRKERERGRTTHKKQVTQATSESMRPYVSRENS